ncbi:MAG: ABC transporter permease [Bacilli bacterium]|nr:ABC transporter permease [Bacilli bacterium]
MVDDNRVNFASKVKVYLKNLSRTNGFKTFTSVLLSILLGLLIGLIILLISNPRTAFPAFGGILIGSFGDPKSISVGIGDLLYYATPILLTGLSVGFAFKTGLFNIGASGQFMVGQFSALMVAFYGSALGPFQWVVAILAGILAGAFWGFIPGIFKALLNVNEVITSIMFNYIGMYLTNMLISGNSTVFDKQRHETFNISRNAFLPKLGMDKLFPGSRADIGFLIAILVAVVIYLVLNKTKFGFEIKGVGYNRNASRYAGINEKKSIILSMAIAGALAGLGGALKMIAPGARYIGNTLSAEEILAPEGFNGIPVALLGLSNPIGIIFSALFITHIQRGGFYVQSVVMIEIIDIITAVIIYFSAFSLAFRLFIGRFIKKKKEAKAIAENQESENSNKELGGENAG